ncbi:MAG TPA: PHB depolymerase family esterase [Pirellulaceae bacterium]|nr:PHB depolymerase family esterase [Pirellulaceae bacterium]
MAELTPGDHEQTITVGTRERKYLVHVPKLAQPPAKWPVVVLFHGGGSNPKQMVEFTGMNACADKHGFVVIYPAGTGIIQAALTFNAGNCCGRALRENVDEVGFITAVLDQLPKQLAVDEDRVFATGLSNGGMMSYLMADKLSQLFAAVAPVGGPMGSETCAPERPVPVIHFHGRDDDFVPYAGGIGRRSVSKTNFFSVEHSVLAWVQANGCEATPQVEELPNKVEDGTRITRHSYTKGRAGSEVVVYEIHGGGHTWPGHTSRFKALGKSTQNIDVNEVIWAFFARHPRPSGKK